MHFDFEATCDAAHRLEVRDALQLMSCSARACVVIVSASVARRTLRRVGTAGPAPSEPGGSHGWPACRCEPEL